MSANAALSIDCDILRTESLASFKESEERNVKRIYRPYNHTDGAECRGLCCSLRVVKCFGLPYQARVRSSLNRLFSHD